MQAFLSNPARPSRPEPEPSPWLGLEPEDLEDAARRLCAARPGSGAAERLMERAAYLRASRFSHRSGVGVAHTLLFS